MSRKLRIPSYRRHQCGQARVTLDGIDHLLGPYNSAASKEAYRRAIAEWLENKDKPKKTGEEPISVAELIVAYWKHATAYYGWDKDPNRGDASCVKDALRIVKKLYAGTPAKDFGPLALKCCRSEMHLKDWSRTYTNSQVDRIRRMFRWGAEEQLVPGAVYQDLRSVASLRRGKSSARETERVKPVPAAFIDAALPFMPPAVAAMVQLQLVAGCRPAELCIIRPVDIDMGNPACWVFRPAKHKTQNYGRDRLILLGPRAQAILRPFLGTRVDAYCFSPACSEDERNARRRESRKSPMTPSQHRRKRKARRARAPGNRYDTNSYRRAINRACVRANEHAVVVARKADPSVPEDAWIVPKWSPNRLRHNRATELRPHGLDVTKTILGHNRVETSQVYAEKDMQAAMLLVSKIG